MTHNDLVEKLRSMLATATHGDDVTATVLLFGVLFDEEIRDSGSSGTRIGEASGKRYGPMVTDGQKLARLRFVEPTPEMVNRWKREPGAPPTRDEIRESAEHDDGSGFRPIRDLGD